ncbi:hypothetical protein FCM50_02415, partial [Mycoplasma bovis]|nr:hypothetical protein [Mycoplasmopsis bovis]
EDNKAPEASKKPEGEKKPEDNKAPEASSPSGGSSGSTNRKNIDRDKIKRLKEEFDKKHQSS